MTETLNRTEVKTAINLMALQNCMARCNKQSNEIIIIFKFNTLDFSLAALSKSFLSHFILENYSFSAKITLSKQFHRYL